MIRRTLKLAIFAAAAIGSAASVNAGVLPISATVQVDGNNHRYTYGVVLTSDSVLKPGDFFTIYDFDGAISGSNVQPTGWTFSTSAKGGNPAGTVPTDSDLPNLTWTYAGASNLEGQMGLGNFSVISSIGDTGTTAFTARTHRQVDDAIDSNITEVTSPVGGTGTPPPGVPEPSTLLLLGIGLPLVGAARYLRGAKQSAAV